VKGEPDLRAGPREKGRHWKKKRVSNGRNKKKAFYLAVAGRGLYDYSIQMKEKKAVTPKKERICGLLVEREKGLDYRHRLVVREEGQLLSQGPHPPRGRVMYDGTERGKRRDEGVCAGRYYFRKKKERGQRLVEKEH